MGRPTKTLRNENIRLKASGEKNYAVQVRLTEEEYGQLCKVGDDLGCNHIASIVRIALKNYIVKHLAAQAG